jgi:transposase-like protein
MSKLKKWQKTISDWQSSGLSKKQYCQNHNLKVHTLHYWIKKFNEESATIEKFIPFAQETKPTDLAAIELSLGNARILTTLTSLSEILMELDRAGLLYDPT